jgi:alkyldihydroxyacetonephosphate synthase
MLYGRRCRFLSFFCSYSNGACIYFYLGFSANRMTAADSGGRSPLEVYEELEARAREEIMRLGGSISHHHGIGKIRKRFAKLSIGDSGFEIANAVKNVFDPKNIFVAGNGAVENKKVLRGA